MSGRCFGLDVVRAFAILSVLWGHTWYYRAREWCLLGGDGVAVFFVLSGFLVGGMVVKHVQAGGGVVQFLIRRWLRTLPAYWVVLLVLVWLYQQPLPIDYAFFLHNLDGFEEAWFVESWSLSVEEWFYLAFTALVFALTWLGLGVRSAAIGAALVLIALSAAYTVVNDFGACWATDVRFSVLGQLGSIAVGVLMAIALQVNPGLWWGYRGRMAAVGAVVFYLAFLAAFYGVGWPWLGLALLPAYSVGAVLVLPWAVSLKRWSGDAGRLVDWLSAHAYALYLVNWALVYGWLLPRLDLGRFGPAVEVGGFWLWSGVLAVVLRILVERPFMAVRDWRCGARWTAPIRP